MARKLSGIRLGGALNLVPTEHLVSWSIETAPRAPSAYLLENFRWLRSFDTTSTDAAKHLFIDALFREIVPEHDGLKVFKGVAVRTEELTGIADYLVARQAERPMTPLLCARVARSDDFLAGQARCIAEMVAYREKNAAEAHRTDIYGIVSNGTLWDFYRLSTNNEVWLSQGHSLRELPNLLGVLDFVFAACAANLPAS